MVKNGRTFVKVTNVDIFNKLNEMEKKLDIHIEGSNKDISYLWKTVGGILAFLLGLTALVWKKLGG